MLASWFWTLLTAIVIGILTGGALSLLFESLGEPAMALRHVLQGVLTALVVAVILKLLLWARVMYDRDD